jgi:hypothetical protein
MKDKSIIETVVKSAAVVAIACVAVDGIVKVARIIAAAIEKAYAIPDVSEIVAAIGAEDIGNG